MVVPTGIGSSGFLLHTLGGQGYFTCFTNTRTHRHTLLWHVWRVPKKNGSKLGLNPHACFRPLNATRGDVSYRSEWKRPHATPFVTQRHVEYHERVVCEWEAIRRTLVQDGGKATAWREHDVIWKAEGCNGLHRSGRVVVED